MIDPPELSRAIHAQLELDSIYADRPETEARVERKLQRIAALRAWAATLSDPKLTAAYNEVLDSAQGTLERWKEDKAFEDRAMAIKDTLPPLPKELW
jgi:hypothetical protein